MSFSAEKIAGFSYHAMIDEFQVLLLLTWFNINPNMDK